MQRERSPIISRFPRPSLTTTEIRWLHEEAWEDGHKLHYARLREAPPAGLYAPLPFVRRRRVDAPRPVGRWLLETAKGEPLAAVEVQAQVAGFTTVLLLLSGAEGGWLAEPARTALPLLLSGVMLLTKADVLRIAPIGAAAAADLAALELGPPREVWSPVAGLESLRTGKPGGLRIPTVVLDPVEWWTTERGAAARKTLAYLEKRLQTEAEQTEAAQCKPTRLKGLARLSRLLRWN